KFYKLIAIKYSLAKRQLSRLAAQELYIHISNQPQANNTSCGPGEETIARLNRRVQTPRQLCP
ncbi:MAG: hypothetical protein AB8B42_09985, partial [Prochlorococcus sp.]